MSIGRKVRFLNPIRETRIVGVVEDITNDHIVVRDLAGRPHHLALSFIELFDIELLDGSQTAFSA